MRKAGRSRRRVCRQASGLRLDPIPHPHRRMLCELRLSVLFRKHPFVKGVHASIQPTRANNRERHSRTGNARARLRTAQLVSGWPLAQRCTRTAADSSLQGDFSWLLGLEPAPCRASPPNFARLNSISESSIGRGHERSGVLLPLTRCEKWPVSSSLPTYSSSDQAKAGPATWASIRSQTIGSQLSLALLSGRPGGWVVRGPKSATRVARTLAPVGRSGLAG